MNKNVVIVGASDDPEKYSYKALKLLKAHSYNPIPVNPTKDMIDGIKCLHSISELTEHADTFTIYVRPQISSTMIDEIIAATPERVIMNPGAENTDLKSACEANGIRAIFLCTLVLLGTGQFEKV